MIEADGPHTARALLRAFEITARDLELIRALGGTLDVEACTMAFGAWLEPTPAFERHLSDPQVWDRVRRAQVEYWLEFFSGRIDDDYVAKRVRVGEAHARIGLEHEVYFAAMSFFMARLTASCSALGERALPSFVAASKLASLDQSIVTGAISAEASRRMAQRDAQAERERLYR